MEALIAIERLGRHGEVIERQRLRLVQDAPLRIGRGWDCDLLLDDPYVAALHAELRRHEDGSLWLHDAGSLNGLLDSRGRRQARIAVGGEAEVCLGQTRLRLRDARGPVAAERPLLPAAQARVGLLQALGWLLVALATGLLFDWLGQVGEVRSSALLIGSLAGGVVMLAWSFGWALITRLFSGEMRFLRHLRVVAVGSLLASLLMLLVQYLGYALAFEPLQRFAYAGYWLLFAAVCWRHLVVMGPGHPRSKALAMLGVAVVAIGLQSLSLWQPRGGEERGARYVRTVVMPAFRLRPAQDVERFLDRAAALEPGLIEARSEDDGDSAAIDGGH